MHTDTRALRREHRLLSSVHAAHAHGMLANPEAVDALLAGISRALEHTVESNAQDPHAAWALHSEAYWNHFEMNIKESLLIAFAGTPQAVRNAVRLVVERTIGQLQRTYRFN